MFNQLCYPCISTKEAHPHEIWSGISLHRKNKKYWSYTIRKNRRKNVPGWFVAKTINSKLLSVHSCLTNLLLLPLSIYLWVHAIHQIQYLKVGNAINVKIKNLLKTEKTVFHCDHVSERELNATYCNLLALDMCIFFKKLNTLMVILQKTGYDTKEPYWKSCVVSIFIFPLKLLEERNTEAYS